MNGLVRKIGVGVVLTALLVVGGCRKHRKTTSAENTEEYAEKLHVVVSMKKLPSLRWPNFSDYESYVTQFYEDRNYEVAWTRDGKPTASAEAFMQAFKNASAKGLIPEDYDSELWADRVAKLQGPDHKPSADAI